MLKTSRIGLLAGFALAFSSLHAATIDELVSAQRDALKREALNKAGGSSATPPPSLAPVTSTQTSTGTGSSSSKAEDLRLIGVYGLGNNLTADIYYNGVVFSIKQGGEAIDGWRAEKIGSTRVVLKQGLKSKQKTHILYLSEPVRSPTASTPSNFYPGMGGGGTFASPPSPMPPMPMQTGTTQASPVPVTSN